MNKSPPQVADKPRKLNPSQFRVLQYCVRCGDEHRDAIYRGITAACKMTYNHAVQVVGWLENHGYAERVVLTPPGGKRETLIKVLKYPDGREYVPPLLAKPAESAAGMTQLPNGAAMPVRTPRLVQNLTKGARA